MTNLTRRSALCLSATAAGILAVPGLARASGPTMRFGYPPQVECVSAWLAQDHGLFAKHGVEVELTPINLTAMVPALASGSSDMVHINALQGVQAIDVGLPITLAVGGYVLPVSGHLGLAKRIGAALERPEDLFDARIAVGSLGSIMLYMFNYWCHQRGLDYTRLRWIEADGPTQREMFRRGELDAALTYDPWYLIMVEEGMIEPFVNFYDDMPDGTILSSIFANSDWAAENPEAVGAFRAAVAEGMELAATRPELAYAAAKKWVGMTDDMAAKISIPHLVANIGPDNLDHLLKVMKHQELLTTDLTPERIILPWR